MGFNRKTRAGEKALRSKRACDFGGKISPGCIGCRDQRSGLSVRFAKTEDKTAAERSATFSAEKVARSDENTAYARPVRGGECLENDRGRLGLSTRA